MKEMGVQETAADRPQAQAPGTLEFQEVVKITRLAGMLARPFFQSFAEQYQITLNEWRALVLIVRSPALASQDIAEFTGLHAMNVSRAVAGLRKQGRVESSQDPANHRRQLLTATDAGEQLVEDLLPSAENQANAVMSVLTPDERVAFSGMLERLIAQSEFVLKGAEDPES